MEKILTLRLRNQQSIEFCEPVVMGIINVSPNSFYRPHGNVVAAVHTAQQMIAEGAQILDVGGEATNPFVDIEKASPTVQQEIDRVVPVVEAIKQDCDVLVSVDTSCAEVMRASVAVGADIINDQRALRRGDAMATVGALQTPVCLMHFFTPMRQPDTCDFSALFKRIQEDLMHAVKQCEQHGIARDRIILDPGFGGGNFGKSTDENYSLLAHVPSLVALGFPLLSGWSRKSMIGDTLQVPPEERLYGSIIADAFAIFHGAAIIRTHDVKAASDAIKVAMKIKKFSRQEEWV